MTLRPPQSLSTSRDAVASPLDAEIAAEKAASLGRAGRAVEETLQTLRVCTGSTRFSHARAAAAAVHSYFIQREFCGFTSHEAVIEHYDIPRDVLALVGAR